MTRQRKCGRFETFHGVARFALVPIARFLELTGVRILVAIQTTLIRHLVTSVLAVRDVALSALYRAVFAG